jgi:hypothetical protein
MGLLSGPSAENPLGDAKERLGNALVDQMIEELSVEDCVKLAIEKMEKKPSSSREDALVITKLQEARLWLMQSNQTKRKTS